MKFNGLPKYPLRMYQYNIDVFQLLLNGPQRTLERGLSSPQYLADYVLGEYEAVGKGQTDEIARHEWQLRNRGSQK